MSKRRRSKIASFRELGEGYEQFFDPPSDPVKLPPLKLVEKEAFTVTKEQKVGIWKRICGLPCEAHGKIQLRSGR